MIQSGSEYRHSIRINTIKVTSLFLFRGTSQFPDKEAIAARDLLNLLPGYEPGYC